MLLTRQHTLPLPSEDIYRQTLNPAYFSLSVYTRRTLHQSMSEAPKNILTTLLYSTQPAQNDRKEDETMKQSLNDDEI